VAQFIRIESGSGTIGRINVEHIIVYFPHEHREGGCDEAGMERCRLQTELILVDSHANFGTRLTVEEVDRLINPAGTP
jgi:hypothetical protein